MADSDQRTLVDRMSGTLGIEEGGGFPGEALRQLFDISQEVTLAGDGDAASTIANTHFWHNGFDYPVRIVQATVVPAVAVTGDAADNATISLLTQDAAAGTPVSAASLNSDVPGGGDWEAFIENDMTLVPANCVVAAGGNVYYAQAKGANGVDLPVRVVQMRLRRG